MAEHSELVGEIPVIEKMTTQERLKHAKKRRTAQLKKWNQYEKQLDKEHSKKKKSAKKMKKTNNNARRVIFVNNVMLLEAAARNDIEEVRDLLQKGVSPDVTNEDGLTALHQCCIDDLEEMMKLLIQFRANVNARDSELWTPLHAAATCGHVHLCNYLIDNGAELLAVNADGNMPYDICEDEVTLDFIENEMAKRGVTQELIDETRLSSEKMMLEDLKIAASNNEDLEFKGRSGETPLHVAAANGYFQVAEWLLERKVQVDIVDDDSWQPVHCAACWGHLPVLEILIQYGADLDAKTKNGETPFDICEDPEIRDRILEMKTEIESNKRTRTQRLVRRRSTNTRSREHIHGGHHFNSTGSLYSSNTSLSERNHISASVRRTSMREKGAMSLKEAKEERERFRESASSNDEEEKDELNGVSENTPATDIDEVNVEVKDPNTDTNGIEDSPEPTPPPQKANRPLAPVIDSSATKDKDLDDVSNDMSISLRKQSDFTVEPTVSDQKPQTPPQKPAKKAVAPSPPRLSSVEAAAAAEVAPPPPKMSSIEAAVEENGHESEPPSPTEQEGHFFNRSSAHQSTPAAAAGAGGAPAGFGATPPGTLSDLKKKRAQELRDSMRFKEAQMVNQQIQNYNQNYNNPMQPASNGGSVHSAASPPHSNGQNGTVGSRRGSDASYYDGVDPPKHKFTASTQEIVGGSDSKTGCCVVQ